MSPADLNLLRQWFNAVLDLNPAYLQPADYALAARIHEAMGLRVPASVQAEAPPAPLRALCDRAEQLQREVESLKAAAAARQAGQDQHPPA